MVHLLAAVVDEVLHVVHDEDSVRSLGDLHLIYDTLNAFIDVLSDFWLQHVLALYVLQYLQGSALRATLAAYEDVLALVEDFEAEDAILECE